MDSVDTPTLPSLVPIRRAEDGEDRSSKRQRTERGGPRTLEECEVDVLLHNRNFLVINKPADVRLDGPFDVTVETIARRIDSQVDKPRWIHQLDFATSGVLCIGLNRLAAGNTGKLFAARHTNKVYLALVRGFLGAALPSRGNSPCNGFKSDKLVTALSSPAAAKSKSDATEHSEFRYADGVEPIVVRETWTHKSIFLPGDTAEKQHSQLNQLVTPVYGDWLEKHDTLPCFDVRGRIAGAGEDEFRMHVSSRDGREARTQVLPVAHGFLGDVPVTKVLLRPLQGRRHQLRLHLLHLGYPIVGDATYGPVYCHFTGTADESFFTQQHRMYLHALHLELPFKSSQMRFKRPRDFFYDSQGVAQDFVFETLDPFEISDLSSTTSSS